MFRDDSTGIIASALACVVFVSLLAATAPAGAADKSLWKPLEFAIVRVNDSAPQQSWNIYHNPEKKGGPLLVRIWKRYLLIRIDDEEAYDIDPGKIKQQGDNVEWSLSDVPSEPIETSEWKVRDVSYTMRRVRFRFGKDGHFMEIQLPMQINGKPAY
jgi:hypothetical protein